MQNIEAKNTGNSWQDIKMKYVFLRHPFSDITVRIKERNKLLMIKKLVLYLILIIGSATILLPFYWMIATSLKGDNQIFAFPPQWIPTPIKWSNYYIAVTVIPFLLYLKNTLTITFISMIGTVITSSMVGYSFAKIRWPGRDTLFVILLATLMLPGQVTMVPVFVLFKNLGWINTFKPLIVPSFLGGAPFFIFLMRQFFLTLPNDLEDAARIDGCGVFTTFWKIMLPQVKPALATVAIFTFMAQWNDFIGPLIYLTSNEKRTLALGLQSFVSEHVVEWNLLMAASTILIVPLLIIFFFAQRYFIQGIALTGIKG